jgi:hypothetical protein
MNRLISFFRELSPLSKVGLGLVVLFFIWMVYDSTTEQYSEGMHFGYHIKCENGFVYKCDRYKAIQIMNSDGTPLKCGKKPY